MARFKGENWFRSLREFLTQDPPAVRFELRERTSDGSAAIQQFTIPEGWDDDMLLRRVGELAAHAQDDCNGSEIGRRAYFIAAYDLQNEPMGRSQQIKFFSEKNALDDEGGGELEGPSGKGLMAQLMRHTEAMVRINQSTTAAQIQAMTSLNSQLLREKQEVEERRINLLLEMEQLISQRHQRDMEEKREAAKEERMAMLFGQLQRVMPALVARLLPGTAVAADASAQALAAAMKGVIEGLPDDKMAQIIDALGPEKGAALVEVVTLIQQIETSPSQATGAALVGGGNGAAHA
jgi:hypothetical protein